MYKTLFTNPVTFIEVANSLVQRYKESELATHYQSLSIVFQSD